MSANVLSINLRGSDPSVRARLRQAVKSKFNPLWSDTAGTILRTVAGVLETSGSASDFGSTWDDIGWGLVDVLPDLLEWAGGKLASTPTLPTVAVGTVMMEYAGDIATSLGDAVLDDTPALAWYCRVRGLTAPPGAKLRSYLDRVIIRVIAMFLAEQYVDPAVIGGVHHLLAQLATFGAEDQEDASGMAVAALCSAVPVVAVVDGVILYDSSFAWPAVCATFVALIADLVFGRLPELA